MEDIKIFVSHRTDIDSELNDNPLFINMRCGAAFDKEKPANIRGDDTGDNISEKKDKYSELSVQYWAWKNCEADYYGLCHYRRFLSFSDKKCKANELNMIYRPMLLPSSWRRYGLDNPDKMRELISRYDIVSSQPADVRKNPTPDGKKDNVYGYWMGYSGVFFESSSLDILLTLIDELCPEYSQSAKEYFNGRYNRACNCYIMKKELFFRMCEMQFDIMFEIEKKINMDGYTQTMKRTPAYMGEILCGIFIYHVTHYENRSIKEQQLIFFNNADKITGFINLIYKYTANYLILILRGITDPIFPLGSKRRNILKKILYTVLKIKNRGIAKSINKGNLR